MTPSECRMDAFLTSYPQPPPQKVETGAFSGRISGAAGPAHGWAGGSRMDAKRPGTAAVVSQGWREGKSRLGRSRSDGWT